MYLEHGYSARESLTRIYHENRGKKIRKLLSGIMESLDDGAGWQETFQLHCYGNSSLQLLSRASSAATLCRVCSVLEKQLAQELELDQRVTSALVYPVWVLILTLCFSLAYCLGPLGEMGGLNGSAGEPANIIVPLFITLSLLFWAAGLRFACIPVKPGWLRTVLDRIPFLSHLQRLSRWLRICSHLSIGTMAGAPLQDQLAELSDRYRGSPEAGVLYSCAEARFIGDWQAFANSENRSCGLQGFQELRSMFRSIISGEDSLDIMRSSSDLLSLRLQKTLIRACAILQPLAVSLAGVSVLILSSRIISNYHGRILEIMGGL